MLIVKEIFGALFKIFLELSFIFLIGARLDKDNVSVFQQQSTSTVDFNSIKDSLYAHKKNNFLFCLVLIFIFGLTISHISRWCFDCVIACARYDDGSGSLQDFF